MKHLSIALFYQDMLFGIIPMIMVLILIERAMGPVFSKVIH
jgi:hypothetical protein